MAFEAPTKLIDPVAGTVAIRLVPFHRESLHGASSEGPSPEGDDARPLGLPFRFLPDARPIDLVLHGGMSPADIGSRGGFEPNSSLGRTSWWRWGACALTPFGWAISTTPFFEEERRWLGLRRRKLPTNLTIRRAGEAEEGFNAIEAWLRRELGNPSEPTDIRPHHRTWHFPWGGVHLYYEPRDGKAEMGVRWLRPKSAA